MTGVVDVVYALGDLEGVIVGVGKGLGRCPGERVSSSLAYIKFSRGRLSHCDGL